MIDPLRVPGPVVDVAATLVVLAVMFTVGAIVLCSIDLLITGAPTGRCAILF